jgi:hypothetical protein
MRLLTLLVDEREKQWQEELARKEAERQNSHDVDDGRRSHHHHHHHHHRDEHSDDDGDHDPPQPLLDQKPAVQGVHPRELTDPIPPVAAPIAVPVPDIKLEQHDAEPINYSDNV